MMTFSGTEITKMTTAPTDTVDHPEHYQSPFKIECIDAIAAATHGLEGLEAVCVGNSIKYLWRWKRKGGVNDLRKSRWYLDKLIANIELGLAKNDEPT